MLFADISIQKYGSEFFLISTQDISNLEELTLKCTNDEFTAELREVTLLNHIRPNFCEAVRIISRTTRKIFDEKAFKLLCTTIENAKLEN